MSGNQLLSWDAHDRADRGRVSERRPSQWDAQACPTSALPTRCRSPDRSPVGVTPGIAFSGIYGRKPAVTAEQGATHSSTAGGRAGRGRGSRFRPGPNTANRVQQRVRRLSTSRRYSASPPRRLAAELSWARRSSRSSARPLPRLPGRWTTARKQGSGWQLLPA